MTITAASWLCHATVGLIAVLIAGGIEGWWAPPRADVAAGLLLTSSLVGAGLQLARRRKAVAPIIAPERLTPAPPTVPAPVRRAAPPLVRIERRAHPRFAVDWAVAVHWRGAEPAAGRLRDISRGGAFLNAAEQKPVGTEGVLRIDGISVPVPCRIVGVSREGGMNISFAIEGLGLDAFLAQLDAKLDRTSGPVGSG